MKATGIVRRIDDLGRVVIPKEIRRTAAVRSVRPRPPAEAAADFLVCIRRQELPAGSVPVRARAAGCVREWIRPGRR